MMSLPLPPPPPGCSPEEMANYLQRRADDGAPVFLAVVFGLALIGLMCFGAYGFGDLNGRQAVRDELNKDRQVGCLRQEDRQFARTGFLGMGSGEIYTQRVCVEWRVTR